MIERLLERFRLKRVVVIADRGMLSLDNVVMLEACPDAKCIAPKLSRRSFAEPVPSMVTLRRELSPNTSSVSLRQLALALVCQAPLV